MTLKNDAKVAPRSEEYETEMRARRIMHRILTVSADVQDSRPRAFFIAEDAFMSVNLHTKDLLELLTSILEDTTIANIYGSWAVCSGTEFVRRNTAEDPSSYLVFFPEQDLINFKALDAQLKVR